MSKLSDALSALKTNRAWCQHDFMISAGFTKERTAKLLGHSSADIRRKELETIAAALPCDLTELIWRVQGRHAALHHPLISEVYKVGLLEGFQIAEANAMGPSDRGVAALRRALEEPELPAMVVGMPRTT